MIRQPPWKSELVEGDPIRVGERLLIPIVKVRSMVRRRVTFGTEGASGGGGGLVWLQPVAVMERWPDGSEGHISISDETGTAIQGMLMGALALPILYLFIVGLSLLWRRRGGKT